MLHHHHIGFAQRLELGEGNGERLQLIHLKDRGSQLHIPADWYSLWVPLRGEFRIQSGHCSWLLQRGKAMTWSDGPLRSDSYSRGWCLVLAGPTRIWQQILRVHPRAPVDILPCEQPCPRELRRVLVHLARRAVRGDDASTHSTALLGALCSLLLEFQAPVRKLLSRCRGRTPHRRQQTLIRLLRVERMLRNQVGHKTNLLQLARVANYSPHHLIRSYRSVFGETPTEFAIRMRTQRAWDLVTNTRMPVCEVTDSLGFESQSAFCRAFKSAFGMTTGQARRLPTRAPGRSNVYNLPIPVQHPLRAA